MVQANKRQNNGESIIFSPVQPKVLEDAVSNGVKVTSVLMKRQAWTYTPLINMSKTISDRIGTMLVDSSDKKTYQIVGGCTSDWTGDIMFENRCDGSYDVERTPCEEMLQEGWCTWIETSRD